MLEEVQEAIEVIRPSLQADGGDVELVGISDEGVVSVRLMGACNGCPMSQLTLKHGIERYLKDRIPAVTEVVAV